MNIKDDRFLRIWHVTAKVGLCRATIYNYIKEGKFPERKIIGKRCVGWRESDVNKWMEVCEIVKQS